MLWRKGNRHVWFTSGVNFAITKITKPKYPSVLVRIWFHFWFSAIDAKGLIKTAIDERSFHLRGAWPAHVFHRWVQTLPIRYLPSTEKDTNNRKFYKYTESLKGIFSLDWYVKSHTVWEISRSPLAGLTSNSSLLLTSQCIFFTDIIKRSDKNIKICQLIDLVFDTIYQWRNHTNNMARIFKNWVENKP